jgi:transcriptional regulator with XRE-family HTH domain
MQVFSPHKMTRLRAEQGVSRRKLSDVIGVHESVLYRWETARTRPTPVSIAKIARALGVPYDDLFVEEEQPAASAGRERGRRSRGDNDGATTGGDS